jgi:hypothetical protein
MSSIIAKLKRLLIEDTEETLYEESFKASCSQRGRLLSPPFSFADDEYIIHLDNNNSKRIIDRRERESRLRAFDCKYNTIDVLTTRNN